MTAVDVPAPLLSIADLHARFATRRGILHAVRGVSLAIGTGERVAVVGESGSGKSVTAHAILRLMPEAMLTGSIRLHGAELLDLPPADLRAVRGRRVGMIFQDPMTALDPVRTVGSQVVEAGRHAGMSRREARTAAIDLFAELGIPQARARFDDYPHQFSGGMRQRVVIATALIGSPALLIADEPTTALDVRLQARLLDLIWTMSQDRGMAVLLVSHDLGLVAGFADRVVVMYAGTVQENAGVDELFARPAHPYTRGLLASAPRLDSHARGRLVPIAGGLPSPMAEHTGCPYAPRCAHVADRCWAEVPALDPVAGRVGHVAACHFADSLAPADLQPKEATG